MRSLELTLKPKHPGEEIKLWPISCLHIGHQCHEYEATQEILDSILKDPNAYIINLADTFDNGTKQSPGASVYENPLNPREQTVVAALLCRPLVEAGKFLIWHESNHSWRTFKESGMMTGEENLCRLFCGPSIPGDDWHILKRYADNLDNEKLKSGAYKVLDAAFSRIESTPVRPPVLWAGWQALTKLHAGKQTYMIHSMHGEGTGTAVTAALSALVKQKEIGDADLYLRGHHHKKVATTIKRATWDQSGKARMRRAGLISSGCMLGYHDSYGEAKGLPPNDDGMSWVTLKTGDEWGFNLHI